MAITETLQAQVLAYYTDFLQILYNVIRDRKFVPLCPECSAPFLLHTVDGNVYIWNRRAYRPYQYTEYNHADESRFVVFYCPAHHCSRTKVHFNNRGFRLVFKKAT